MDTEQTLQILARLKMSFPMLEADRDAAVKWWVELFQNYEYADGLYLVSVIKNTLDTLPASKNLHKLFRDNLDASRRQRESINALPRPKYHRGISERSAVDRAKFIYSQRIARLTDPRRFDFPKSYFYSFSEIEEYAISEIKAYDAQEHKPSLFTLWFSTLPNFMIRDEAFEQVRQAIPVSTETKAFVYEL